MRRLFTTEQLARALRTKRARFVSYGVLAGVVGALVASVAVATSTLSTNGLGSGSATFGSVTLTSGASTVCNYTDPGIVPGTAMTPCSFDVTYTDTGSISAYVGLDVLIVAHAGSQTGAVPLYNPGSSSTPPGPGLTFTIKDNDASPAGGHSYTVPATALTNTQCTSNGVGDLDEPTGSICYQVLTELSAWGASNETFANSDSVTWTVTPTFNSTNADNYQGATASMTLTAEAVQSPANPLPSGCTPATIGQSCPASGGFAWS